MSPPALCNVELPSALGRTVVVAFDVSCSQGSFTKVVCMGRAEEPAAVSPCAVVPVGVSPAVMTAWGRLRAECVFDPVTGAVVALSDRLVRMLLAIARLGTARNNEDTVLMMGSGRCGVDTTVELKGSSADLMVGRIPPAPPRCRTSAVQSRPGIKTLKVIKVCQGINHVSGALTMQSTALSKQRHGVALCSACVDRSNTRWHQNCTTTPHRSVKVLAKQFKPLLLALFKPIAALREDDMIAGMLGNGVTAGRARLFLAAPFLYFVGGVVFPNDMLAFVVPHSTTPLRSRPATGSTDRGMPCGVMNDVNRRARFFRTFSTDCEPGRLRVTTLCLTPQTIPFYHGDTPFFGLPGPSGDSTRVLVYAPFVRWMAGLISGDIGGHITLRLVGAGLPPSSGATDARAPPYNLSEVSATITAAECLVPELAVEAMQQHTDITLVGSLHASLCGAYSDSLVGEACPVTGLFAILVSAVNSPELQDVLTLDTAVGDLVPLSPTPADIEVVTDTQRWLGEAQLESPPVLPQYTAPRVVPAWSNIYTELIAPVMPLLHPPSTTASPHREVMTPSPSPECSAAESREPGGRASEGSTTEEEEMQAILNGGSPAKRARTDA